MDAMIRQKLSVLLPSFLPSFPPHMVNSLSTGISTMEWKMGDTSFKKTFLLN
jgi:hypothetical protein